MVATARIAVSFDRSVVFVRWRSNVLSSIAWFLRRTRVNTQTAFRLFCTAHYSVTNPTPIHRRTTLRIDICSNNSHLCVRCMRCGLKYVRNRRTAFNAASNYMSTVRLRSILTRLSSENSYWNVAQACVAFSLCSRRSKEVETIMRLIIVLCSQWWWVLEALHSSHQPASKLITK